MERQKYRIKPKVVNTEDPRDFITHILRLSYLLYDRKDWPNSTEELILTEMLLHPEIYSAAHYTKIITANLKLSYQSISNGRKDLKRKGWLDSESLLSKRIAPLKRLIATSSNHDLEFLIPFIIRGNIDVANGEVPL